MNRLMTLFVCAGFVVVACLAVIILAAMGFEPSTIFVAVSAVSAVTTIAIVLPLIRAYIRSYSAEPDIAPLYVLVIGMLVLLSFEAVLVLNIIRGGKSGLLLVAFSLPLVYGLWIFTRLMTRPG